VKARTQKTMTIHFPPLKVRDLIAPISIPDVVIIVAAARFIAKHVVWLWIFE